MDTKDSFPGYLKTMQVMHLAMVIGLIVFAMVSVFIQNQKFGNLFEEYHEVLVFMAIGVGIVGIIASILVFKRKLTGFSRELTLADKLSRYRTYLLIKWAILEGVIFLILLAFLFSGQYVILIVGAALLIILLSYRPTKDRLIIDMELSNEERAQLEK